MYFITCFNNNYIISVYNDIVIVNIIEAMKVELCTHKKLLSKLANKIPRYNCPCIVGKEELLLE